jgi:MoaA/NifB/PqqE/SkfB family radical SAM enzyme
MHSKHNQVMSMSDVARVIAFLKSSNHPIFRAMGGEPTLHPEFPRIVHLALQEGMRVDLLSNATWPESYNEFFERIVPSRLFFLLNIDHPDSYPPKLWDRIMHNLAVISQRGGVTLSFNIFETQPRYEYILDLAARYKIDKVRMSFSLPVVGAQNAALKLQDYRQITPFVLQFVKQAEALGIEIRFDNALPLCIFSFEQAGELLMKGVLNLAHNARCDPIIDVGPDLTVWCCFCLSGLWNRHLDEFKNLQEIQTYYRQSMGLYQDHLYPMDECYQCRYRERLGCQGGCLAYTILRYGVSPVQDSRVCQAGDGWKPGAIVCLSEDVEIQHYDIPEESYVVYNKISHLEMEIDASFQSLLALLNGQYTAPQVVERFVESNQTPLVQGPIAELSHRTFKEGANNLLLGLLHEGFLVERD